MLINQVKIFVMNAAAAAAATPTDFEHKLKTHMYHLKKLKEEILQYENSKEITEAMRNLKLMTVEKNKKFPSSSSRPTPM